MKNFYFLLLTLLSVCSYAQVQIGTDTNQFQDGPFDPSNVYSYSQSIYLSPEINATGTITELQWYFSGTTLLPNSQDLTIYLGHTTKTEFTSTSDWEIFTNLTQVYTGGIDVSAGEGWVTITFNTPFAYNGSDHLIVAVDENMAGSDNFADDFYNSEVSNARTMTYRSFSTNPDPVSPPDANAGTDSYVPNVIFGGITQTCPIPTDGMALSTTTTMANLDWTIGGSEALWDIEIIEAGAASTGTPTDSGISKPYSATALTSNTDYEFYVRADCSGGDLSAWNGPFSFRTACDAIIDDFSEDFNTMPEDLVTPYCWNTIITTTGTDDPFAYIDSNFSTPDDKHYYMNADEEDTVMLISPNSSIISDGTRRVEFMAEINNNADATPILVGTMSDSMDDTTFTELRSYVLTEDFATYFVNVPSGTDGYFAFKHGTNTSANRAILIDNIVVTSQPNCLEVFDLSVSNITSSGADLSWTVDGQQTQTEWEYVVQPLGTGSPDAGTMQIANSNPTSVSGLDPNTDYEIYIRANCDATGSDGSGVSDWAGPANFRTGCSLPIDDFSENFDTMPDELEVPFCWAIISQTTGTAATSKVNTSASQSFTPENYYDVNMNDDDTFYLVAPQSTTISDGMHRVEFAAKVNSTTGGESTIMVGVMSDPNDDATFVELQSFMLTNSSNNTANYTLYYVNVPFSATHQNLAFKYKTESTANKTFYLDSILVTTQPSCFDVLDLEVSNITDASFDVTFTPDYQTQTEWELVVKQTDLNFNPALETPIVTTSTFINVTADSDAQTIIPNAPYRIFVRANCDGAASDGSGQSEWFGPIDIVTNCASFEMGDLTFPEMFEADNNDDIIPCWSSIVSEGTGYVRYSTIQENDGTSSVRFFYPTSTPTSAYQMLVSPAFSDLSTDKQIKFWVYDNDNSTLSVGTMSDSGDTSSFTELQRFNNGVDDDFETPGSDTVDDIPDDTWTELTVDFTTFSGSDQNIAIRMLRGTSFSNIYIDTFTYELNPNLSATNFEFENTVKISPNPTRNVLQISGQYVVDAEVYSINGKQMNLDFNNSTIDVSSLAAGMYFVKLTNTSQNSTVLKFIKN